jgi:sugar lactone lactonase YvrE
VVLVVVVVLAVTLSGRSPGVPRRIPHSSPSHRVTTSGPRATEIQPSRPGALAFGPDGNLYLADNIRNQVLERLGNGTFQVVAGDGAVGSSGDGGPATKAELNYPASITFGPGGTLYIADYGNGRIRAVSPAGIISTVAGSGQGGQGEWVTDGTQALDAGLLPSAVTFGPDGLMYVASGNEILRLGTGGAFTRVVGNPNGMDEGLYGVGGPAVDASADGPNGLAFDKAGNLYIAGSNTKTILMVNSEGTLSVVGSAYPRGDGGLVTAPDGAVLAMDELEVLELTPRGGRTIVTFPTTYRTSYLGITGFSPNGIAVAPNGTVYLDTFYGNGYADRSALVAIAPGGHASLLWTQGPPKGA